MIARNELFDASVVERHRTERIRPLGDLSTFVVETLPHRLLEISDHPERLIPFIQEIESLCERYIDTIKILSTNSTKDSDKTFVVARLDVLMLQVAIHKSGGRIGPMLSMCIDAITKISGINGLTYEDIVLNNPDTDLRLFSTGEVAVSEAGFYLSHKRIEELLIPLKIDLMHVVGCTSATIEIVISLLQRVRAALHQSARITSTIKNKMKVEHFDGYFRRFLAEDPITHHRGPSGAFTSTIPLFDFLIAGENVPEEIKEYISKQLQYYPQADQEILKDYVTKEQNRTIRGVFLGEFPELRGHLKKAGNAMKAFRRSHLSAAQKHTARAMKGLENGTGGETDVAAFLLYRLLNIRYD